MCYVGRIYSQEDVVLSVLPCGTLREIDNNYCRSARLIFNS